MTRTRWLWAARGPRLLLTSRSSRYRYGARKRLEHRYKSLRYASEREGISVTDPAKYAERFQRFLFDKFVTLGDDFVPATAPAAAPAEAPAAAAPAEAPAPVPEEPPEQAEAPAPA